MENNKTQTRNPPLRDLETLRVSPCLTHFFFFRPWKVLQPMSSSPCPYAYGPYVLERCYFVYLQQWYSTWIDIHLSVEEIRSKLVGGRHHVPSARIQLWQTSSFVLHVFQTTSNFDCYIIFSYIHALSPTLLLRRLVKRGSSGLSDRSSAFEDIRGHVFTSCRAPEAVNQLGAGGTRHEPYTRGGRVQFPWSKYEDDLWLFNVYSSEHITYYVCIMC